MLEFRENWMDKHNIHVYTTSNSLIGNINWHDGVKKFVPIHKLSFLRLSELEEIVDKMKEIKTS